MSLSRNRLISKILDKDTGLVKGSLSDSDQIVTSGNKGIASSSAATTVYSALENLPGSATTGDQAFVSSNNGLYIYNGSGWYKVALVNATPYWSSEASSSYTFTIDTAITITLLAGDSDGHTITYTATPDSDANLFITISKDSDNGRIFTLTPDSENEAPSTSNTGTVTFKASDGISFASTVSTFTLSFVTIVDNSAETILLMKADSNSATNAAITYQNSSNVSTGFTETGTPQASTFTPYRSGGYSTYFDGSGDYIKIGANADPVNWLKSTPGVGTFEAWIYMTAQRTTSSYYFPSVFAIGSTWWNFGVEGDQLQIYYYDGAQQYVTPSSSTISLYTWHHVAFSNDSSNNLRIFIDGTLVHTESFAGTSWSTGSGGNDLYIGKEGFNANSSFPGYIKDVRITSGVARYTASFTAPTEPLTSDSNTEALLCHLPYFADGSSNSLALTISGNTKIAPFGPFDYSPWTADDVGGSLYTPTNNNYVSDAGVPQVGSTGVAGHLEFWWYPISTTAGSGSSYVVLGNDMSSGNYIEWNSSATRFQIQTGGGVTTQMLWNNASINLSAWNHIWIQKNASNYWDVWINGKNLGTVSSSYGQTHTGAITPQIIGAGFSSTYGAQQYIADMKIATDVKSTTADFTPPTAPLSHDANTTFLMNNKSDANIYDASSSYLLELNGDTISSTTQRKFTTSSSIYFDGTGDYITVDDGFNFGTADFTFEFWLYPTENLTSAIQHFINPETSGSLVTWGFSTNTYQGYNGITFSYGRYGYFTVGKYADGVWPAQNTWTHLAVQRRNGTIAIFVNGTSQTLSTYNENDTFSDGADLTSNYTSRDFFSGLQGYVQDVRITTGLGRYASNFTPPTAEFEL